MNREFEPNQRRSLRFQPEVGAHAEIGYLDVDGNFVLEKAALIIDESYSGVGLIVIDDEKYIPGHIFCVKMADLGILKSVIVWKRSVGEKAVRMGVNFNEQE